MLEKTCTLIKPHIVEGNAIEKVIDIMGRYISGGLAIIGIKCFRMTPEFLQEFYSEHVGKPYFDSEIVPNMTSGRIIALVLSGENAISKAREINGATKPSKALPGTIRADYGIEVKRNAVHASDSAPSAFKELLLIFPEM